MLSKQLKDHYDGYYTEEDPEWRRLGAEDKAANIVSLCEEHAHDSVVEIGAGDGSVLKRLAELSFANRYDALEISRTAVERIQQKNISGLIGCNLFDGYNLPYADGSFDLAVLSHVIEHVEHPRMLLSEAGRIAKTIFVEVPLEHTARLPIDFVLDRTGHINAYSPKTIRRLLQSCNLEVLRQKQTNPSRAAYTYKKARAGTLAYWVKESFLRIAPRLAVCLFTYHSAIVCRPHPTG